LRGCGDAEGEDAGGGEGHGGRDVADEDGWDEGVELERAVGGVVGPVGLGELIAVVQSLAGR